MLDVLIIGSGGAGLSAALEAKKNNAKVLVLSKTYPTYSQTAQAQGGINAVIYEDDDSVNQHIEDTYKASKELASKSSVDYLCKNAKNTIIWLDELGVPFSKNEDSTFCQRKFGGTKSIRTCYSSDYTGLKILHTLYDQSIKNDIKFLNEYQLLNLIVQDKVCLGVTALDIQKGEVLEILAKTVIICTGGYAGLYSSNTTNSFSNTGDGIVSALNAGVELSNIEFVQFHPTTLEESNILISESARGEGGYLLDKDFKRFVNELDARDVVAREIAIRINNKEKVYLDLRHLGLEKINKVMPQERRLALEFSHVDISKDLLPINPSAHYSMGGINTNHNGRTNIKNLFTAGEASQSSVHGANRLGGNSLLEIVTLGRAVGKNAAYQSKEINQQKTDNEQLLKDIKYIEELYRYPNKINFYDKKFFLAKTLFEKVGLFRNKSNLEEAKKTIDELKNDYKFMGINDKSKSYNTNLLEFIEFKNILDLSEIIVQAALNRVESRGSHYRTDFPNLDESLNKISIILQKNEKVTYSFREIS